MSYIRGQLRYIGKTGRLQIRGDNDERTKWLSIGAETVAKIKALLIKQKEAEYNES